LLNIKENSTFLVQAKFGWLESKKMHARWWSKNPFKLDH